MEKTISNKPVIKNNTKSTKLKSNSRTNNIKGKTIVSRAVNKEVKVSPTLDIATVKKLITDQLKPLISKLDKKAVNNENKNRVMKVAKNTKNKGIKLVKNRK